MKTPIREVDMVDLKATPNIAIRDVICIKDIEGQQD